MVIFVILINLFAYLYGLFFAFKMFACRWGFISVSQIRRFF